MKAGGATKRHGKMMGGPNMMPPVGRGPVTGNSAVWSGQAPGPMDRPMRKGGRTKKADGGGFTLSAAQRQKEDANEEAAREARTGPGMGAASRKGLDEAVGKASAMRNGGHAKEHPKDCKCRECGGRAERKSGGRTKGKTNINIVISAGKEPAAAPPMAAGPMPHGLPPPPPPQAPPGLVGGPPMGGPAGPNPPGGGLPPGLLGRKSGGRTYRSYADMDAGALGGKGRLEKVDIQEHKR